MANNDFVVKNGLTVNEKALMKSTTDAGSATDTAASINTAGGLAVAKKAYVGSNLDVQGTSNLVGNVTITGDVAVNGGDITTTATSATVFNTNATTIDAFEAATTLNMGATTGTATIQNATTVVKSLTATGAIVHDTTTNNQSYSTTGAGSITITSATTGNINGMNIGATTAGTGKFTNTTITGTLTANGGVGTTGQALVSTGTGIQWATPDAITNGTTQLKANATTITATVSGTLTTTWNATYVDLPLTGDASTTSDGAVRIAGGLSVAKKIVAGSIQSTPIGSSVASTGAFTTLSANGQVNFTAGTAAGNGTGTITVSGGIYTSGGLYAGGSSTLAGLSSTSTTTLSPANAGVTISPTGTGSVTINPATAGTINAMSIGATTRASGAFTTLDANSTVGLSPANASVTISPTGSGTLTLNPATAGTINNMSIGATTAATGRFTTVTSTVATGTAPFTVASTTLVSNLNSDYLDGYTATTASTVSTVAVRDGSGDISLRLVRSEFADQTNIGGAMAFRTNNSTDNYVRFCSDTAAIRTFLDVPTRGGTNATGTWGISISGNAATATSATSATNATYVMSPDGDRLASTKLPTTNARTVRYDFVGAGEGNGAGNYAGLMTYAPWDGTSASTGDSSYQLAFANQSGSNASGPARLSIRNGINSTWNAWQIVLTSSNYNSYSPTLTGTGASGTWGISVSGNAATVTNGAYINAAQTFSANNIFTANLIASNKRVTTNERYPLGHYSGGDTAWAIDPTWSTSELQTMFNSSGVQFINDSTAPGGYCIQVDGSLSIGNGPYGAGFPYISIDSSDIFYMECWIKNEAGASNSHYMGSIDFNHAFSNLGGNPGSFGYFVMAGSNPGTSWTKVSGYIGGFGSSTGTFVSGAKYFSPMALFNYSVSGTNRCYISGWKVIRVWQPGNRTFAGNVTVGGTITENSSITYKENVNPIDSALDKVLQLTGVTYDRKDGSRNDEAGLIAEEVAKVIPNVVTNKNGAPDGIQYTKLTAYLIECIKELNAKIDKLEGR